ncbi:putative acetyltransferase [Formosa sp. Hel1_31_208]|uniref:GNAT family N-acetyltransferase n=1 Tax=Formosa sp. Hel1_31_208 TaxID=1798225 RepID=UPI00087D9018|nr:GNAT family N-acetyltransferase [Formosa sp. Hel1_31_208]SDS02714.1 putative acetyltransferase [Formosa sp. Hel1_31_208]
MLDDLEIREATLEDLPEITSIFRDTIRAVNSRDYSEKQIEAWSSGADDTEVWEDRITNLYFIVAEYKNEIVGFAHVKKGCHLDGLYVHKNYQRRTIGSKLLRIVESHIMAEGYEIINADASITAVDFFDSHYFDQIKKQKKSYKGMGFASSIFSKEL